jgi:lipid-binding SYLF domain-containing protein
VDNLHQHFSLASSLYYLHGTDHKSTNQLIKFSKMKKSSVSRLAFSLLIFMGLSLPFAINAQDSKEQKLIDDSHEAKAQFVTTDPLMQGLFEQSYGYVIFPNVGKGAIGVGGAAGNGIVYERGNVVGTAKMKQVSVGFQFGGQAYREIIFFENSAALNRFKQNKFEFAAQASAVAVTKGASTNVKYRNGVMVFTQEKGGLMYEASIGGQKFSYSPL